MISYSIRRIVQTIPLLLGVVAIMFVLLQLTPGNPVQALVGQYPIPPAYEKVIAAEFHLNQPPLQRFLYYLWNLLHGNLGYSFAGHQSVTGMIGHTLPNTLILVIAGTIASVILGILIGALPVLFGGRAVDAAVNISVVTLFAIPTFWFGQLLILFLAVHLGWFPVQGMTPLFGAATGFAGLVQRLQYLTLPMLALCIPALANITRVLQQGMLETISQDYIVTAELKGLPYSAIVRKHVLRNSMLPVTTVIGYGFGTSIAGTVLIETVFSWPGVGNLLIQSIGRRDNQVIVGIVLVAAVITILANLVTDLVYGLLDPRIRTQ